ncbi:DUF92 domain-containing protein [Parafilimonas terrae]|uniref:TIGR00297 family protein n=1 Tax=Parafilimonas terrae TaxID=1465490 RepID=A0A1I5Y3L2_9BACT|nr:DUF92 domain-containing protein [Parafilimonas terrae]SFQ38811.1 TIGR00297 family protein [Parafilimonas terrae]
MFQNAIAFILLSIAAVAIVLLKKLDTKAAVVAVITGFIVWLGTGYTGITLLAAFFITGTLATSWKMRTKQQAGLAEQHHGQRTAAQVMANGGVTALLSLLAFMFMEQQSLFLLMIASGLSSAIADTLSSELGNVYGKKFYNIVNFKKDLRGLNGVISFEGTLIGIAGSILIASIYSVQEGFTIDFLWIVIAGTIGNLTDSVLGATAERKDILNNNAVNFLNTLTGAVAGLVLHYF